MKLNELTFDRAEELGILPVHSRVEKLMKLKATIDAVPFDAATAEAAQCEFISESADAREGLGAAWDRIVLAISFGWDIPDSAIEALSAACAENAKPLWSQIACEAMNAGLRGRP